MASNKNGVLILIGGHEDRTGYKPILAEVARRVGKGPFVLTTVASSEPDGLFEEYQRAFKDLGVERIADLAVSRRSEAIDVGKSTDLTEARGLFFTGGDQLKI